MGELEQETEVVVIGAGPGGYAAAFRAADLGLDVTLIDMAARPGGVCLHRGCIPSKTFLYLSQLIYDAGRAPAMGINFGLPKIDLSQMRAYKKRVIDRLANGLAQLTNKRGIQYIQGRATFENSTKIRLEGAEISAMRFQHAIIATGSRAIGLPGAPAKSKGVINSSGALALADIPSSLLVVGGGYVGVELGTVYASLGSRVTLVEADNSILAGVDRDLVAPLQRRLQKSFEAIHLETTVTQLMEQRQDIKVTLEGAGAGVQEVAYERVLVAIGRRANSKGLGLENTRVQIDERGIVVVDDQQRTDDPHIWAVGDVAGGVMLAHKASREGKIAAEVIAGQASAFDARAIPAVVYTDPQIAWAGMTEIEAQQRQRPVAVERFPWKLSGRATTMDAAEGLTKIIADPETQRILGIGIVGREAEGLVAEGVLAIEMGALIEDVALSIHPHPSLSETESEAAEIFLGSATHMIKPKNNQTSNP
jgi:dihydrolipoamide dehydrogenase